MVDVLPVGASDRAFGQIDFRRDFLVGRVTTKAWSLLLTALDLLILLAD